MNHSRYRMGVCATESIWRGGSLTCERSGRTCSSLSLMAAAITIGGSGLDVLLIIAPCR